MLSRWRTGLLGVVLIGGLLSVCDWICHDGYRRLGAGPGGQLSSDVPAHAPSAGKSAGPTQQAPTATREAPVPKATDFFFHPHVDLQGMSVVHFLAWDIAEGEKVPVSLEVVVAEDLAVEVMEIFREVHSEDERFPIHDVVGYDYRSIAGGRGLSNHACGRAIDLNRAENPMFKGGKRIVHPDEPPYTPGEWRPGEDPYSIIPEGSVVRIFKSHGWRWGGEWTSCKDYQHFDKPARGH